jgi:hypothetical protein
MFRRICSASAVSPLRHFQARDGATIGQKYSTVLILQHIEYKGIGDPCLK